MASTRCVLLLTGFLWSAVRAGVPEAWADADLRAGFDPAAAACALRGWDPARPVKVVAVGGSITAGQGTGKGQRYTELLPKYLAGLGVADVAVTNWGHHGAGLCAFAKAPRDGACHLAQNASVLVLEAGVNDAGNPNDVLSFKGARRRGIDHASTCAEAIVRACLETNPRLAVFFLEAPGKAKCAPDRMRALGMGPVPINFCNGTRPGETLSCALGDGAQKHTVVACGYGAAAQLSLPHAFAAVLRNSSQDGIFADFHLGPRGHDVAAAVLARAIADGLEAAPRACDRALPPVVTDAVALRTMYDALFSAQGSRLYAFVSGASRCALRAAKCPHTAKGEIEAARCGAMDGGGGWFAPRGTLVNAFHYPQAPRDSGLFFCAGEGAGAAEASATLTIRGRATPPAAACNVELSVMHSYENFGPFEVYVDGGVPARVDPRWNDKKSVPQTVTVATLPCARALSATVELRTTRVTGRIAIYGLHVVLAGKK